LPQFVSCVRNTQKDQVEIHPAIKLPPAPNETEHSSQGHKAGKEQVIAATTATIRAPDDSTQLQLPAATGSGNATVTST